MADVRIGEGVRRMFGERDELGHRREDGRVGHIAVALEDDLVDADGLQIGEYRLAFLVAPDENRGCDAAPPGFDGIEGVRDRFKEIGQAGARAVPCGLDDLYETFGRLVETLVVAAAPLGSFGSVVHIERTLHGGFAEDFVYGGRDRPEIAARKV